MKYNIITKEHKEQLIAWYQSIWEQEKNDILAMQFDSTGPFSAEQEKEIRLRTLEADRESYMMDFQKNLDDMPAAYFPILENLTRTQERFDEEALRNEIPQNSDVILLVDCFHNKGHRQIKEMMERMVGRSVGLQNFDALNARYMEENYPELDYSFEEIDAETISQTPEIKDNARYSKKDREIAWKKEVARLEKAEKDRVAALKGDKEYAKGEFNIYLRNSKETGVISKDEAKKLTKQYGEYEKENKKLDAAIDFYHKMKLERDKLHAKMEIFGSLSARDERKLAEYEQKVSTANANRAVVTNQTIRDFNEKIAKAGQDINSPHNRLRREQLQYGNTRYFPLADRETSKMVFKELVDGKTLTPVTQEMEQPSVLQEERGRRLDLSGHFEQTQMHVIRDEKPNPELQPIQKVQNPPTL